MIFIRSEYSFKQQFYFLEQAVKDGMAQDENNHVCLIDDTTFGFIKFEKICKDLGAKASYGLTVMMTDVSVKSRSIHQTCFLSERIVLIAKSEQGIKDLYKIYSISTDRYNRFNRILPEDLEGMDVIAIGDNFEGMIPKSEIYTGTAKFSGLDHKSLYQCITGERGTKPYVPSTKEQYQGRNALGFSLESMEVPKASMIKYNGDLSFRTECLAGLAKLGLSKDEKYCERLIYEMDMIESKDFQDYFMIVSDMIKDAKKTMIVGPGRGSSGGSLVCYVLGITSIDPIEFGLIFERFIDINRSDYPDIDTDYPDVRRADVIEQTRNKYSSVNKLAVVSTYSPKTIINDFAKEYKIPLYEVKELKDSIIERSSGDARAKSCLDDTLQGEVGREFLEKYPFMGDIHLAEGHARHHGTHAAGIIVLDEDINNYGSVDHQSGIVCIEGPEAESIGLLKIDCLGLRTLSIIENCLNLSGVALGDIYDIPLDDPAVLEVFNGDDLSDIFQFDGAAIGMVCGRLTVDKFSDLTAITALGRPGALNSGGTDRYIRVNEGEEEPVYYGDIFRKVTEDTNGIVVYQEQTMVLLREFGNLSWGDVNTMRKIISKSRGDEFFNQYKEKFLAGALENGYSEKMGETVWDAIASMGSYAFNKSHAVAYAMISYWCAHCKHHYPFNFLAANLNNAKDDDHGLKLLRKYVKAHDIDYIPVDADKSQVGWTIQNGKLVGGLTNINGIGEKKALDIIKRRKTGKYTKTQMKALMNPVTKFDELYPIEVKCKRIYDNYNITRIDDIDPGIEVTTLGKLVVKDLRDRNDVQSILKRGGKKVTDNTHYLNLVIEDDTGTMKGTIAPFDMDRMEGMMLSERLVVGEIIALHGTVREGWSTMSIKGVKRLDDI